MMSGESPSYDLDAFLQFIFDNADINVHSLDGYNTFIAWAELHASLHLLPHVQVPRIRNIPPATTLESVGNIPIKT